MNFENPSSKELAKEIKKSSVPGFLHRIRTALADGDYASAEAELKATLKDEE